MTVFLLPGHFIRLIKCNERQLTNAKSYIYIYVVNFIAYYIHT